jgi:hypothetical protein
LCEGGTNGCNSGQCINGYYCVFSNLIYDYRQYSKGKSLNTPAFFSCQTITLQLSRATFGGHACRCAASAPRQAAANSPLRSTTGSSAW